MRRKLIALLVSTVSLIAGLGVVNPSAAVAACRTPGWFKPQATVGGTIQIELTGSVDAYFTGTAKVGRSPCSSRTQRIYLVHQTYKWDPSRGTWVPYIKTRASGTAPPRTYANLASQQAQAPTWMTATTTIYWYDSYGLITKKTYSMNDSSWYYCQNTSVCQVQYGEGHWHIHWV